MPGLGLGMPQASQELPGHLGFCPKLRLHRFGSQQSDRGDCHPHCPRDLTPSLTPQLMAFLTLLQDILTDLSAESETLDIECEVQDCLAHKVQAMGSVVWNVLFR